MSRPVAVRWNFVCLTVIVLFISACGEGITDTNHPATPTRQAVPSSTPASGNNPTPTQTAIPNASPATSPPELPTETPAPVNTSTPTAVPAQTATATPTPDSSLAMTATPVPALTPTAVPTATPAPARTPVAPISLSVWSPIDGAGIEAGAVRVMGMTSAQVVDINGTPVSVATDGRFQLDLALVDGPNKIKVTASENSGRAKSQQLDVFVVATTAGLPFTLLYPSDGLEVSEAIVDVVGVSRPDAAIGVNGVPAEINALGIFSSSLILEEGDNLIEVVAVDLEGNVRFQTVVVFYLP